MIKPIAFGFKELEAKGLICEYMKTRPSDCGEYMIIQPAFDIDESVFYVKGTRVRFMNKNGYDMERERAFKEIGEGRIVTVKTCSVGSSSSKYTFEEVPGSWNTVMFEKVV